MAKRIRIRRTLKNNAVLPESENVVAEDVVADNTPVEQPKKSSAKKTASQNIEVEMVEPIELDAEKVASAKKGVAVSNSEEVFPLTDVKIEKANQQKQGKINKFDLLFIKLWAAIVAFITKISEGINAVIHFFFKRYAPLKYIKAIVSALLIVLAVFVVSAPFNITVNEKQSTEIYGNSLIPVKMRTGTTSTNQPIYKWGYADRNGNIKIECIYDGALPFAYGVAFVRLDDYYILINTGGKIVNEKNGVRKYYIVSNMEHSLPVGTFDDKNKLAWVSIAGKYGFINTSGKVKIEASFDGVSDFKQGLARVRKGNNEYFINKKGNKVGASFEQVRSFTEGLAAVKSNSGWGFINLSGRMAVEYKFDAVTDFNGGYALVKMGMAYGVIDKNGRYVVSPTEGFEDIVPKDLPQFDISQLL